MRIESQFNENTVILFEEQIYLAVHYSIVVVSGELLSHRLTGTGPVWDSLGETA